MAITFAAGQSLTAAALNAILPVTVTKANAQNVTGTTLANDAELVLTLAAGGVYQIYACITATGPTAGDIKTAWALTGTGATATTRKVSGPGVNTTDVSATAAAATTVGIVRSSVSTLAATTSFGLDNSANASAIYDSFIVTAGSGTATLQLQVAQVAASGTTVVTAGAHVTAIRIG